MANLRSSALGIPRPKNNGAIVLSRGGEGFPTFALRVAGMDRGVAFGANYARSHTREGSGNECYINELFRCAVE